MAMNRLTRDDILNRALDRIDSAALDQKERPAGTIVSTAMSIGWIQEALDYFQKKFPFQCNLKSSTLILLKDTNIVAVPADYILDVRDGLKLDADKGRLKKRSLSYILSRNDSTKGQPVVYTIRNNSILVWPTPDVNYPAKLYHYFLDSALSASTVPNFPDDHILVEFVRLMGGEWLRAQPAGTALAYADMRIKELQRSGIMQEAEEDQIDLDSESFGHKQVAPWDWLGKPVG